MSRLGTDVMALACIVGGAAVGGLATMALASDGHDGHRVAHVEHAVECAMTDDTGASSEVVVTLGAHKDIIIAAPDVRVHQPHCVDVGSFAWAEAAEFEVQSAMLAMEQVRVEMEMARELMESEALDLEGLELTLEGLELDMELDISEEIEQTLQSELSKLEQELKRLEEIGR